MSSAQARYGSKIFIMRQDNGAARMPDGSYMRFGLAGLWDIRGYMYPATPFECEVKTGTSTLSKEQKLWGQRMTELGVDHHIARARDEGEANKCVEEFLTWLDGIPMLLEV